MGAHSNLHVSKDALLVYVTRKIFQMDNDALESIADGLLDESLYTVSIDAEGKDDGYLLRQ